MGAESVKTAAAILANLLLAGGLLAGCSPAQPVREPASATPSPAALAATHPPDPTAILPDLPAPTAAMTPTAGASGPDGYPAWVNPLTGLPVADQAVLARRPLIVKISNAPPVVRPQSGLGAADILIEHYAEGGWTRFTAVFYSQDSPHVGSVRSVRLIDLQLTPAFDGVLVFSGGSNGVIDTIRESPLYPLNVISPQFGVGEPTFQRFPRDDLPFEHTLFTDTEALRAWLAGQGIRETPRFGLPGPAYDPMPPAGGVSASRAYLGYARTGAEWQFDPIGRRYLRWTDGLPHSDALTGSQLAFENVIILSAYHEEIELFPEKYAGEEKSIAIALTGEGPATILRDGLAFEGRWLRPESQSMFRFVDSDGQPLPLKPGRSFYQVIRAGFETLTITP